MPGPTAPAAAPPPDLPAVHVDQALTNYLRRFSSWAVAQFQAKVPLNTAVKSVLLVSPGGAVFEIGVGDDGRLTTTPITPGSGAAGASTTFAPVTGYAESAVANPAGTASATYVMMGLNLSLPAIVASTALWTTCDGQISSSANNGEVDAVICYGTGTPPANGAPQAGTIVSAAARYKSTAAGDYVPFSLTALITGITKGQTYWLDVALRAIGGGTALLQDVDFSVHGLA
jgi:hypothetical protein